MNLTTIRGLFAFNDWARDQLMALALPLDDAKLDRPFEMGEGSLRKTLEHLFGAEWVWLKRWQGHSPRKGECPRDFPTMAALWEQWRRTAGERDAYLGTITDADLPRALTHTNTLGETYTFKLGHMLVHVCTHGTHHRAQASNMLRHVGVKPPGMDFLEMIRWARRTDPSDRAAREVERFNATLATVRELFAFNDWGRDRLMALAEPLEDAKLDRAFEMGERSLRKTLEHLFEAEWHWLKRWQGFAPKEHDQGDFPTPSALWDQWRRTASERDAYLGTLTDDDLARPLTYTNHLGRQHTFKLGHMLLGVCNHGPHHRAQVLNMLRHVGVKPPDMDFLDMHV